MSRYDLLITGRGVQAFSDGVHRHIDEDLSMSGKFDESNYTIVRCNNGVEYRVANLDMDKNEIQKFFRRCGGIAETNIK